MQSRWHLADDLKAHPQAQHEDDEVRQKHGPTSGSVSRGRRERGMYNLATVGDHDSSDQFVRQVDGEFAVLTM
jgi:hypothetical protein